MLSKKTILVACLGASFILSTPSLAQQVNGTVRILSVSAVGEDVEVRAHARNTGSKSHEFPVGCSLQRRDGSWLDIPYQLQDLDPNEGVEVTFRAHNVEAREFSLARVAIWHRAKPDGLLETRYDMDEADVEAH